MILILGAAACVAAFAWHAGLMPMGRKKGGREAASDDSGEDNSFKIEELIVGRRYGDCPAVTAADTSEKPVSTVENGTIFAPQDVRGDEPEQAVSKESTAVSDTAAAAPDGTDHREQDPQFNYELILVDGDPEHGEEARDETRRMLPTRPAIPTRDTGKVLEELIDEDQPEAETDATESERKEMESFEMEDFK